MAELANKQDLHESKVAESEKWIQKAVNPANKGGLHKALHVAQGEKIPKAKIAKATHSKNPHLRHMAQFAKNVANEGTCPGCNCAPCQCDEGNEFSGALANARKDHKSEFEVDGKKYKVVEADPTGLGEEEMDEGFADMDAWLASREKEKGTGNFDKRERTLPGGMKATTYTRRHEEEPEDNMDAPIAKGGAPKKRGRPMGKPKGPERVTKGAWKHKGGRVAEDGEYDDEGDMAKTDMHTVIRHAEQLEQHLQNAENLPTWVIEKLGQIKGMMTSVSDYIISSNERGAGAGHEGIEEPELDEEKVEAGKREFFDKLAPAAKKAAKVIKVMTKDKKEVKAPESKKAEAPKAKKSEPKKDSKPEEKKAEKKEKKTEGSKPDFLDVDKDGDKKEPMKKAVKDKEKKEEKVDETTVAGSVATATTSGKSSKGGIKYGAGVYEGFNNTVEKMINESIAIESTMSECGDGEMTPGITIQADGEEAAKLMMLLKLAGLENQIPSTCPSCGKAPCGCAEVVDENKPDWPTDEEESDDAFQYSGGLNGPKSTGQSTTVGGGLPNLQARRQVSMEENVELERNLFKTWKNYKG